MRSRATAKKRTAHGRSSQAPKPREDNAALKFNLSTEKQRSRTAAAALFLVAVLIPTVAHAVTYAFTPIPFAWIDPSSHTVVSAASAPIAFRTLAGCGTTAPITDDTISDPIPLGFNFQFAGVVVDSVRIVSNGRLQFLNQNPGNGAVFDDTSCGFGTPDQFPFPNASVPYTMKVYGADIDPTNIEEAPAYATRCSLTGAGVGPFGTLPCFVSFATTGSLPNQQFVVTWNNVPEWTSGTSPQGNFQLQVIVRQDGTFIYQYGQNSSVSAAQVGWQADPNVGDFDVPNIGPLPPQNLAVEFYTPGPSSVTATGGTPQSAVINTGFATALQVTVNDLVGNPVAGVTVNFAVPGSGASATLSAASAVTNGSGVASVTATANSAAGSYNVTASVVGVVTPATFSLTNTAGSATTMTVNAGTTPQSAVINTAFANALAVTVRDGGSNPVAGVNVTFTAPGSGASGVFSNSTATITVATNASGVAAAPFTANATAGNYNVTASVVGVVTSVTFSLTNTAGVAVNVPTLSDWGLLALPLLLLILSCCADYRRRNP
jgi:MSHA biogenesis protein MshQ